MDNAVIQMEYWSPEDHFAGLCSPDEVGRPRPPVREAKRLARHATPQAIRALIDVVTNSDDDTARIKAAEALLNRGWGKAEQAMTVDAKTEVRVVVDWATSDRLSYAKPAEVVEMAPAPAIEADPPPKDWKPDDASPFVRAARLDPE